MTEGHDDVWDLLSGLFVRFNHRNSRCLTFHRPGAVCGPCFCPHAVVVAAALLHHVASPLSCFDIYSSEELAAL